MYNASTMRKTIVVLLALAVLATGCGSAKEVKLGVEDNGGQIEIEKDQALLITLESNPTTGYRWEAVEAGESVLQQIGEAEFKMSDPRDPPPPGTGGTETFRFKAIKAGQTMLKLIYHRSWEKDVEPLETFPSR